MLNEDNVGDTTQTTGIIGQSRTVVTGQCSVTILDALLLSIAALNTRDATEQL